MELEKEEEELENFDDVVSALSDTRTETYLYNLIDTKLDGLYSAARTQDDKEIAAYQEELESLYEGVEPVEMERVI